MPPCSADGFIAAADGSYEVGLNVHPVLVGAGIPIFLDAGRRIEMELKECRPMANGCFYVVYDIPHAARSKATQLPPAVKARS